MNERLCAYSKKEQHLFSGFISIACVLIASFMAYICRAFLTDGSNIIPLLYVLNVILVSMNTAGYIYGILESAASVIMINYLFTYPYYNFKFTIRSDYIAFMIMAAVSFFVRTTKLNLIKQAEIIAEREKQLAEVEKEKMRANLLRAISHDLRTPLTGIMGNCETVLKDGTKIGEDEKKKLLTNIYDDSKWLLSIVENLLAVTRINADDLSIAKTCEPVEEVIAEAVQKVKKRYPDAKINIEIPDELILLPMDAILIEQVIINLIGNAVVHSESKKPIEFIVRDTKHTVIFTVRDYGKGICAEKEMESKSSDADGMGIGLSICKTIIMAHYGTILGRNHGEGAEFIFTLPKEV